MNLSMNRVYGIVYRSANGTTTVFNGRVVAKSRTHTTIRFMNSRGVIIRRALISALIIRAILI
jgi:hypothetical protein